MIGRVVVAADEAAPRHSEASVLRALDGRLLLAWSAFSAVDGPAPGTAASDPAAREWAHSRDNNPAEIRLTASDDGGSTWGLSRRIVGNDAAINVMQPALARLPDGALALSYSRRQSADDAARWFMSSDDEGLSWRPPVMIASVGDADATGYVTAAHDRLLVLGSGRILQPCHTFVPGGIAAFVARSDDGGRTWRSSRTLRVDRPVPGALHGFWEAGVAERPDGSLLLAGRTAVGRVYASESFDAGETWSEPVPLTVVAPSAPSLLRALGDGRLILVHNTDYREGELMQGPRTPHVASVSADGGSTWQPFGLVEEGPDRWFHYPSCLVEEDALLLSYSVTDPETRHWSLAFQRLTAPPDLRSDLSDNYRYSSEKQEGHVTVR
jgi:hypothetical protein